MLFAAAAQAAEVAETAHIELPLPPIGFGLITFGAFLAMLAVTYAFRSVGTRH